MYHLLALALAVPFADVFPTDVPDGFVRNRTLIIGFVAALVLAFFAKLVFRRLDTCRAEQQEEQQEITATTGDGPPRFNG